MYIHIYIYMYKCVYTSSMSIQIIDMFRNASKTIFFEHMVCFEKQKNTKTITIVFHSGYPTKWQQEL